jgi:hypothetical protein
MKFTDSAALNRVVAKLHELFHTKPACTREDAALRPGCIARQYANCEDYAHCPHCGTVEQSLRAGSWIERNWRRMGGRDKS